MGSVVATERRKKMITTFSIVENRDHTWDVLETFQYKGEEHCYPCNRCATKLEALKYRREMTEKEVKYHAIH